MSFLEILYPRDRAFLFFIQWVLKENILEYFSHLRQSHIFLYPQKWGKIADGAMLLFLFTRYAKCFLIPAAAAIKSLQSCLTLSDPIDGSQPGSPVPGILQARTLEWVAISFSNARKSKVKVKSLSRVWLLATPQTAAHQASPSIGFSRQEYWSGLPLPSLNLEARLGNGLHS